jgi:hypothetical protein
MEWKRNRVGLGPPVHRDLSGNHRPINIAGAMNGS